MKPELEICCHLSCGQCRGCHMEPTCQTGRDKTNTRRARAYVEGLRTALAEGQSNPDLRAMPVLDLDDPVDRFAAVELCCAMRGGDCAVCPMAEADTCFVDDMGDHDVEVLRGWYDYCCEHLGTRELPSKLRDDEYAGKELWRAQDKMELVRSAARGEIVPRAAATFYHVWAAMILRGMAGCKFAEGINDYGQGERRYVAMVADHRGVCEGV